PFATHVDHLPWHNELHGFSWLRHFGEARGFEEREFARTLVLDWIGRHSEYDVDTWGLGLSSRRVMNWLRHYGLLTDGAERKQIKIISHSIAMQVQAAKLRAPYAPERIEELIATILSVSISLCDGSELAQIEPLVQILCKMLEWQLDGDGFYRSRNGADQLLLLEELVSLRLTLSQRSADLARELGNIVEKMHLALDSVTLGTGEPVYFNGCGQLPTELIFATQSQGAQRRKGNCYVAGYGVVELGPSLLVLDEGRVPLPAYARNAHASALAFEFSHGRDLVVGSCGPAPEELRHSKDLFRQGAAHSAPMIDDSSSARFSNGGVLISYGEKPKMEVDGQDAEIVARTGAYRSRYGVEIERRLSILANGDTLVGQDVLIVPGEKRRLSGSLIQRFHLAPGAKATLSPGGEMISIILQSGAEWTFIWEAALAQVEPSVRQSAHLGYYNTQQIVLEAEVEKGLEVSWIFTRR
ncbi:MAG: heparinase II/III family protein, partial [Devosiaceae bacterium]|nr:heparinase II/III family protein [Devosiaceae bacterium]